MLCSTVMNEGLCTGGVQKVRNYTARQASAKDNLEINCVLLFEWKLHITENTHRKQHPSCVCVGQTFKALRKTIVWWCAQIPTKTPRWHGSTHSLWSVVWEWQQPWIATVWWETSCSHAFFFLLLGVCALDVYMDARQSWSQCTHVLVEFVRRAAYGLKAFCLGSKCCLPLLWHVVCGCWGLQAPILLVFCNLLHHCTSSRAVHVMCWFVHVELLLVASCRTWFFKHQVFASLCKAKSCCILSKWLQTNTFLTAWFFLPEYIVDVVVTWKML